MAYLRGGLLVSSLFHISKERGHEINFDLLMACGSCDRWEGSYSFGW